MLNARRADTLAAMDMLDLRKMIEGRVMIVGEMTHELRLVGVRTRSDGGATLEIGISGTDRELRLSVSEESLRDLASLRLRIERAVRQIVTGELPPGEVDYDA